MQVYEIEQYEIHTQTYRVEASNEADAIRKLFEGETEAIDGGLEYIQICEDLGLPVEENQELADELHSLDVSIGEVVISSIASIRVV